MSESNELIIDDGKEIEIYIGEGAIRLHTNDQLKVSARDKNFLRMIEIKNRFAFVGVILEREHIQKINSELTPEIIRELKEQIYLLKKPMNEEVIVSGRDWRFYLGLGIEKFSRYNRVEFKTSQSHLGSTQYMRLILNAEGIEVAKDCTTETGRMQVERKNQKITNKEGISYEAKIITIPLEKGEELKEQEEIEICTYNYVFRIKIEDIGEIFKDKPDFTKFKLIGKLIPKKVTIENYENKYNGKFEQLRVNELNWTKIPSLFMYTK